MIEKPIPLVLQARIRDHNPTLSPKDALKIMLEASDRRENGLPSPLDEIDPQSLDELINRIDGGALALNQVPDPNDIEKLVQYYWSLREKHNLEVALGIAAKPTRSRAATSGRRLLTPLDSILEPMLEEEE
jgi:hypothetical protein